MGPTHEASSQFTLSLKSLFNYLVSGGEAETQSIHKDFWKRDAVIMPRHLQLFVLRKRAKTDIFVPFGVISTGFYWALEPKFLTAHL